MADEPRFVPPEQHPVAGPPAASVPPAPPAPSAPPAGYVPPAGVYTPPPVYPGAPKKRGMPVGGIIGIIVGVLLLVILALVFLVWYVSTQIDTSFGDEDYFGPNSSSEPLVEGDRSSPVAVEPLECANDCLDADALYAAVPVTAELERIGVNPDDSFVPSSTPHIEHIVSEREWLLAGSSAHVCFFTSAKAPLSTFIDENDPWYDEESIFYLPVLVDDSGSNTLEQSARVFADSATASAHMAAMDREVDECTGYSTTYHDSIDDYDYTDSWDVTRAPALDLPASVAAVGWVESNEYERGYTFDIQRGNVVVRSTLVAWDGISEKEFRSLTETAAQRIAALPLVR